MQEFLTGFGYLGIYFLICASAALLLRAFIKIHDEVFRKLLHCILLGSLSVWVWAFSLWWQTALSAALFALIVYPILCLAERIKGYSKFVTERNGGELKRSLLIVFFMFAAVTTICWGWLQDRYLVLASIYAWGFGDAAAALVGTKFGKHKIGGKIVKGHKSLEGSLAMFVTSLCCVTFVLLLRGGLSFETCLFIAVPTAFVSAFVELYTDGGMDTVTCPFAAMAVLLPLIQLFS